MKIEGSVALVTGANRGIGKAIANELLARGAAKVYAGVRDPDSVTDDRLVAACAPAARPTAHACLRYAQRVLGRTLDEGQLRADPLLRARCERGIARLLVRAVCARRDGGIEVWVARTRAMIVQDAHVLTVLVAATDRGFGKRFLREAHIDRDPGVFSLSSIARHSGGRRRRDSR